MIISHLQPEEEAQERPRKKSLLYTQVLEKRSVCTEKESHGGVMSGKLAQPRTWGAERTRTHGQMPLLGDQGVRGFHWCV